MWRGRRKFSKVRTHFEVLNSLKIIKNTFDFRAKPEHDFLNFILLMLCFYPLFSCSFIFFMISFIFRFFVCDLTL